MNSRRHLLIYRVTLTAGCAVLLAFGSGNGTGTGNSACGDPQEVEAKLPEGALLRVGSFGDATDTYGVYDVAFSGNGDYLATRTSDQIVHIWDARNGKPMCDIDGHEGRVTALGFTSDGQTIVTASSGEDERIAFWDVNTGELVRQIKGGAAIIAFREDGKRMLAVDGKQHRLFDTADGRRIDQGSWSLQPSENCVNISQDGKLLAIYNQLHGSRGRHWISIRNLESGEQKILRNLTAAPVTGRFSPDGKWLLVCCRRQNHAVLWRLEQAEQPLTLSGHTEPVQSIGFSPDGWLLATTSWDGTVRVWEVITGRPIVTLSGHLDRVCAVAFSHDSRRLASGASGRKDKSTIVWDVNRAIFGHPDPDQQKPVDPPQIWERMASVEAADAYQAMSTLIASPENAVTFLAGHVDEAATGTDIARIKQLVQELNDDRFLVREAAHSELLKMRSSADAILRKALNETDSAEVHYRITRILAAPIDKSNLSDADLRRMYRVVHALELIGSEAATVPLTKLADAHPEADIMQSAQAALQRLNR